MASSAKIRRYSARLSRIIYCIIIQQIDNKARNIFKSFCRHFFTLVFLPTYEGTNTAGYLLPTDDRYREHHDHIWKVLQFVE